MEDLDHRRFEDLIRQLAYGFRTWRVIEPTGRLGNDEGVDIRAIEVGSTPAMQSSEEDEAIPMLEAEREWRIQCKRYKKVSPRLIKDIVHEVIPSAAGAPHGLIIATSAEVSADSLAAFHSEASSLGVVEHQLWGRTHIEDLLYLPANDHLLFAYFGISIQSKVRTRLIEVRHRLATKRKLIQAFDIEPTNLGNTNPEDVLIRDIEDASFPYDEHGNLVVPGLDPSSKAMDCRLEGFHPLGVLVSRYQYMGWLKPDGTWDVDESSRSTVGRVAQALRIEINRRRRNEERAIDREDAPLNEMVEETSPTPPQGETARIFSVFVVPYDEILELDRFGDPHMEGVHLFCRYAFADGPKVLERWMLAVGGNAQYFPYRKKLNLHDRRRYYLTNGPWESQPT